MGEAGHGVHRPAVADGQRDPLGERRVLGRGGEEAVPVAGPALQEVLAVHGAGEGVVEVEHGQRTLRAVGAVGHPDTLEGRPRNPGGSPVLNPV